MRSIVLVALLFSALVAASQEVPQWETQLGYSYLRSNGVGANGVRVSGVDNITRRFAGEFEFSTYWSTARALGLIPISSTARLYMGGPRVAFRPAFLHALFGAVNVSGGDTGGGDTGFATALGGSCNVHLWGGAFLSPSADYIFTSINSVHENS